MVYSVATTPRYPTRSLRGLCQVVLVFLTFAGVTLNYAQVLAQTLTTHAQSTRQEPPWASSAPSDQRSVWWQQEHDRMVAAVQAAQPDLLFLGDSITAGWTARGKNAWQEYYGNRRALTFAANGDQIQNLLWHIDHGALDNIKPSVIVILIGTNNLGNKNAEEIARGILAVVKLVEKKQPKVQILLMGLFPRMANSFDIDKRPRIKAVNSILAHSSFSNEVIFKDVGQIFEDKNGNLIDGITVDGVHPTADGYAQWAAAIEPILSKWLGPMTSN